MKYKKYLAVLMGAMTLASAIPAVTFAESNTSTETTADAAKPEGKTDGEKPDGEPPEKPDGESDGEAPDGEKPDGEAPDGEKPDGEPGGGMGGANTQTYDYSGELNGVLTADGEEVTSDGEEISASEVDQNALLSTNGGSLTVTNGIITKSGDDEDGDSCNFYGINSIALAVGEDSTMTITSSTLSADSEGSNAVFATDNSNITVSDTTIATTSDNSRGLDATYGGTITADNMTITTEGDHSATVATDRGGGTITLNNGTLSTAGQGSPLLYSTGSITADGVTGTATGSQIAGMEGLNSLYITNSDLTSTITDKTASDPVANGVILYQSTSGDADTSTGETAVFSATDSSLTSSIASGSMFYVTNTDVEIDLTNTVVSFDSASANLLQVEGNDANNWGTPGSNGADVVFNASGETLSGTISVDTISTLQLNLADSTTYTGAIVITENEVNTDATESPVSVTISGDSTWVVTDNCEISNLTLEEGASLVDADGNTVAVVSGDETVVEGTSAYTVTVTDSFNS